MLIFCLDALPSGNYDEFIMESQNAMTLDPENLRAAMRAWSAGVTVVTTVYEDVNHRWIAIP